LIDQIDWLINSEACRSKMKTMEIASRQEGIRSGASVQGKERKGKERKGKEGKGRERKGKERTKKYRQADRHDGAKEATFGLRRKD